MSSLIDRGMEAAGGGRQRIGLTGFYPGKDKVTVDINLTTVFTWNSSSETTSHPVERDGSNPSGSISDHVIPKLPTISMDIILTDDLKLDLTNAASSDKSAKVNTSVSMKDKIKIISYWQRTGTIVTLEGYTTGKNPLSGSALNYLKSGIGNFFDSELKEDFYLGLDSDIIKNLVISSATWKRMLENGKDCAATISLQRAYTAIAKTKKSSQSNTPKTVTKKRVLQERSSKKIREVIKEKESIFGDFFK